MKYEEMRPENAATIEQGHHTPTIAYVDLLDHVRERRKVELEDQHPGRESNTNAVSNTIRSLTAFMQFNGLSNADTVGEELIGIDASWPRAIKALGTDSTAKRRKSEMNARVRPWAMDLIRTAQTIHDGESFGERLRRLREAAGLNINEVAKMIVRNGSKKDWAKINNWETGKKHPAPDSLVDVSLIERGLGLTPGALRDTLPSSPYYSGSSETGVSSSLQRRVAQHLPSDFTERSLVDQDEILAWVSENILSAPKEVLEGEATSDEQSVDLSIYALTRNPKSRLKMAPQHLLREIDEITEFKTTALLPIGMKRNKKWGPATLKKNEEIFLSVMGTLHQFGIPEPILSISAILCPQVIDSFIEWKRKRRGGYTSTISNQLEILLSLVNEEFGFIAQSPGFGQPLTPIRGLITVEDVCLIQDDWAAACGRAHSHLAQRFNEVRAASVKGRDPFEALLPVLEVEDPLREYYKIVQEVRLRMPDDTYPVRRAEALRGLVMLRLGLELGFRQKNNREMLICHDDQKPRSWKELSRLQRGEMSFDGTEWLVRMPRTAFKNAPSNAVDDENTFHLEDVDGLYSEIEAYFAARRLLLGGFKDPGTLFVKKVSARSKTAEYGSTQYYQAFRALIEKYGIYNPYTCSGAIKSLRPHGPHSVRHILATASVKKTRGFSDAASLLVDSEEMIKSSYARFLPGERHGLARRALWDSMFDEGDAV